jgi:hypothetical protein
MSAEIKIEKGVTLAAGRPMTIVLDGTPVARVTMIGDEEIDRVAEAERAFREFRQKVLVAALDLPVSHRTRFLERIGL